MMRSTWCFPFRKAGGEGAGAGGPKEPAVRSCSPQLKGTISSMSSVGLNPQTSPKMSRGWYPARTQLFLFVLNPCLGAATI